MNCQSGFSPPPFLLLRHCYPHALLLAAALFLGLLVGVTPSALAQLGSVHPTETLRAGQRINAFVDWQGTRALEGVSLDLPDGWQLVEVDAVRQRTNDVASFDIRLSEQTQGRVHAYAPHSLRGPQRLILGLVTGSPSENATIDIMPMRRREDGRMMLTMSWEQTWRPTVARAITGSRGRAFRPEHTRDVFAVSRRAIPTLSGQSNFTVEAWIKGTGRRQVILSTWNGEEYQGYPMEWLIDVQGRLVVFRGEPNNHVGIRTESPVADGRWHHVAVTHDANEGLSQLFLDGRVVDSLESDRSTFSNNSLPLVVGGRRSDGSVLQRFTGVMDELRIWDRARSPEEIQYTMRQELSDPVNGMARLGFDETLDMFLIDGTINQRAFVASDLSFSYPVESLTADVDGLSVRITWETKDRDNERFTVERSTDGRTFSAVGRVRREDRIAEASDGTMRYAFTDVPPGDPLLYYRIRQHFAETSDRLSAALKLGLGADGQPASEIRGNSPNPFSNVTTISFELQETSPVRVTVWDVSGSRVAVLIDGTMSAGIHDVRFDASSMPSGIYFVQLQTDRTRLTHKMTLTR